MKKGTGVVRFVLVFAVVALNYLWRKQGQLKSVEIGSDAATSSNENSNTRTQKVRIQHPYLNLLKTETKDWKVFDASSTVPLFHDRGYECRWSKYRSQYSGKAAEMCLHQGAELISDQIEKKGHWNDCFSVSRQYHASFYNNHTKFVPLHLEIGANIGSCTMELLLSNPDVHVVAFEPFPKNLFSLSSTLLRNPSLHQRVTIFPIALGSERKDIQMITEASTNMGTARLYAEPGKKPATRIGVNEPESIHVERLDEILTIPKEIVVPFLKMDAQGSECSIVEGMRPLFPRIARLITEVDLALLADFKNCSASILLQQLRTEGMDLYRYFNSGGLGQVEETKNSNVVGIRPEYVHKTA